MTIKERFHANKETVYNHWKIHKNKISNLQTMHLKFKQNQPKINEACMQDIQQTLKRLWRM